MKQKEMDRIPAANQKNMKEIMVKHQVMTKIIIRTFSVATVV